MSATAPGNEALVVKKAWIQPERGVLAKLSLREGTVSGRRNPHPTSPRLRRTGPALPRWRGSRRGSAVLSGQLSGSNSGPTVSGCQAPSALGGRGRPRYLRAAREATMNSSSTGFRLNARKGSNGSAFAKVSRAPASSPNPNWARAAFRKGFCRMRLRRRS